MNLKNYRFLLVIVSLALLFPLNANASVKTFTLSYEDLSYGESDPLELGAYSYRLSVSDDFEYSNVQAYGSTTSWVESANRVEGESGNREFVYDRSDFSYLITNVKTPLGEGRFYHLIMVAPSTNLPRTNSQIMMEIICL